MASCVIAIRGAGALVGGGVDSPTEEEICHVQQSSATLDLREVVELGFHLRVQLTQTSGVAGICDRSHGVQWVLDRGADGGCG